MEPLNRVAIRNEVLIVLRQVRDDWQFSQSISEDTGLFRDLGFESIDAVALGSLLEEYYNRSLPFAEFLTTAKEENVPDITVGRLVSFLMSSLSAQARGQTS
jgi:acyl carrier protein